MPSCDRSRCRVVARSYRVGIGSVLVPLTDPLVDLPFGFVASDAVAFLNLAHELLGLALDEVHIVIGQHAPLLANLALELIPLSLERVLVHDVLHSKPTAICVSRRARADRIVTLIVRVYADSAPREAALYFRTV